MLNPRKNQSGSLFSTENPAALKRELGINDDDRVLDVGSGGSPLPWAQCHLDNDLKLGHHRDGREIPSWANMVQGDICSIPFGDKSFDWACCIHVLEHVASPDKACAELIRVARRGFIETPWKGSEIFGGYPSHRWLISLESDTLVFEPRTYIEHPFENFMMAQAQSNPIFRHLCVDVQRNLTCVQLVWEDCFTYEIRDAIGAEVFDYGNPDHACRSHASYALNVLRHGTQTATATFHVEHALRLLPGSIRAAHIAAIIYSVAGRPDRVDEFTGRLQPYADCDEALNINIPLLLSGQRPDLTKLVVPGNPAELLFYEKTDQA
ncbi:MAG: class I SAM-dependent methyltransferase [Nitrospirae bacterium]|nr:class I SAM-dependent methyltransferase [Nitrospirota bacterium]